MKKAKNMLIVILVVIIILAIMCYYMCKKEGFTPRQRILADKSKVCRINHLFTKSCVDCTKKIGATDAEARGWCLYDN